MKDGGVGGGSSVAIEDESLAEVLHGMSQPLTTLECGLELAIRYDTTLVQVRHRLKVLLEAAQILHQRLLELRAMQSARTPADRRNLIGLDNPSVE